jgi:hypothetical protein
VKTQYQGYTAIRRIARGNVKVVGPIAATDVDIFLPACWPGRDEVTR